MRFTKGNRQKVLNDNEGFSTTTSYSGRNFQEDRTYSIADGKLSIRAKGKHRGRTAGSMILTFTALMMKKQSAFYVGLGIN